MRRLIIPIVFIALAMSAGCRLSRESGSLGPPWPSGASPTPGSSVQPQTPAASPAAPAEPVARVYLDSLVNSLAAAQEQTKAGKLGDLSEAKGPLALSGLTLSLLESSLPEAVTLHELNRAAFLLGQKKGEEAAKALDELILRIEPEMKAQPAGPQISTDKLQRIVKAILAKEYRRALRTIQDMTEELAASARLKETREIRADLQEAADMAAREKPPVLASLLQDALDRASSLGESVPAAAPPSAESTQ